MAAKTETGERVNNDYGHSFALVMPNVEGACVHCGVRIGMYSETAGWDGMDQFRCWIFPDGSWRKFGTKNRADKNGVKSDREVGVPKCTVTREVDPKKAEQARLRFGRGKTAGDKSGAAIAEVS
jgi:hypothetical protein